MIDLLKEIGMMGSKLAFTIVETGHKPKECWDKTHTDRLSYQKLVGKLIYLSHNSLDICCAVSLPINILRLF